VNENNLGFSSMQKGSGIDVNRILMEARDVYYLSQSSLEQ
jgi:hypothetical protein